MARRKKPTPLSSVRPGQQFTLEEVLEILRTFNVVVEPEQPTQEVESQAESVPEPKRLYTVVEAGQRLRIGRTTVYDLIKRGELDSVHIGRRRLSPAEAVDSYLSSVGHHRAA
ncbi:helix-turn-helix domain-containing protein [Actinomadura sp. 6N118]|uniref:helix-turn-helix domain-containing protein n=1 Tax=Actinomadura sp. 6N118 TaxID=3375151 RepID=UPI00378E69EB